MSLEELIRGLIRDEVRAAVADALGGKPAAALVTIATYAATRSISPSTVRAAIAEGRLSATKIGRSVRIPVDATITPRDAATGAARILGLSVVK